MDPATGRITYAPDRGRQGSVYSMRVAMDWRDKHWQVVLFPCRAYNLYDLVDPQYLTQAVPHLRIQRGEHRPPGIRVHSRGRAVGKGRAGGSAVRPRRGPHQARAWSRHSRFPLPAAQLGGLRRHRRGSGPRLPDRPRHLVRPHHLSRRARHVESRRGAHARAHRLRHREPPSRQPAPAGARPPRSGRKGDGAAPLERVRCAAHRAAIGLESRAYPDVKGTAERRDPGASSFSWRWSFPAPSSPSAC